MGYVEAQEDECESLKAEQAQYLEKQSQIEEELHELISVSSQDIDVVYSQLMKYVGKSLGDTSAEAQRVQLVASVISEKSDLLFEQADFDDEKAYEWVDTYSSCDWDDQVEALEEWQTINYENLTTIATFLSGYATMMNKWPAQWEKLRERVGQVDESSFDQVEEVGKGLEESTELMSDTFEYTKEAFEAARP